VNTAILDTGEHGQVERFFQHEQPWNHLMISAAQTKGGPVSSPSLAEADASDRKAPSFSSSRPATLRFFT